MERDLTAMMAKASAAEEAGQGGVEETEDSSLAVVMALPNYDDMTEQKVVSGVRDVFKGFDSDSKNTGMQIKDENALASYVTRTIAAIHEAREKAESEQLLNKAAALARFWYLGDTINAALSKGSYGANACIKLATAMNKSVPYVYQIRAVSTRLSVVDCYLLGFRNLDTTHLRKLAQIKDDTVRKTLLKSFIDSTPDTGDPKKLDAARRRLVASINACQSMTAEDIASTDPLNGGSEIHVSPEWQRVMDAIAMWQKLLRKPALEGPAEEACGAMADFYITDDTVDAAAHLDEVKNAARLTRDLIAKVKANLDDLDHELECLGTVEVTSVEETREATAG